MIIIEDDSYPDEKASLLADGRDAALVLPPPVPPGATQTVNIQLPPMSRWMAKKLRWWRAWKLFRNVGTLLAVVVGTTVVVFVAIHLAQYRIVPAIPPPRKYSWDVRRHGGRKRYEYPLGMGPPPNGGPNLSYLPPPSIPPPKDRTGTNWGSPTSCNASLSLSTVDDPLRYALELNETDVLSVQVLGAINGTIRVHIEEGMIPDVAMAVTGAPAGLSACWLANEGPHQGLGIWTQPYTLSKDGSGLVKAKNCTKGLFGAELEITHTVDIVLHLPRNASLKSLDVFAPYMDFRASHPLDAFEFDDVVITVGGSLIFEGLRSQNIWAAAGLSVQGNVTASSTYLATDFGEIWTNITVAEPQNGTSPSITLSTCNAPVNAQIIGAPPGLRVNTRTTNSSANVFYSL